jgi:hypothetical protein
MASQNPQLVRLLRHETPHFVRFDVKALEKHIVGRRKGLNIQMLGRRGQAGTHKVH